MKWMQARNLLRPRKPDAKRALDGARGGPRSQKGLDGVETQRAGSICVASGKGGTGKSVVCASLASLLARRGETLVVDADMGIGNAHILHGVSPEHSFVEFVRGDMALPDVVQTCREQLDLIAAGSGVSSMAGLSPAELLLIAAGIEELEVAYRHVVVDSAAGISDQTVGFAASCDVVLVVTTPDVTSLTDAYAFMKVLLKARPLLCPQLVVNRARSFEHARDAVVRMEKVTRQFLGRTPRWVGWIPDDLAVSESVNSRSPVVIRHPRSPAGRALEALEATVYDELRRVRHDGLGRSLLRRSSYSPKRA